MTCAVRGALADARGGPAEGDGAARPRLLLQRHSELLFALPAPAAVSLAGTEAMLAANAGRALPRAADLLQPVAEYIVHVTNTGSPDADDVVCAPARVCLLCRPCRGSVGLAGSV